MATEASRGFIGERVVTQNRPPGSRATVLPELCVNIPRALPLPHHRQSMFLAASAYLQSVQCSFLCCLHPQPTHEVTGNSRATRTIASSRRTTTIPSSFPRRRRCWLCWPRPHCSLPLRMGPGAPNSPFPTSLLFVLHTQSTPDKPLCCGHPLPA
jgi:hypothetical protein